MDLFKLNQYNKFKNSLNDTNECWKTLKQYKRTKCQNHISPDEWVGYFKDLLNTEHDVSVENKLMVDDYKKFHSNTCNYCLENNPDMLNITFTVEDVIKSIDSLKSGKALGPNGVINELQVLTKTLVAPILVNLFNKIMCTGVYLEMWSKAII